MSLFLMIFYWVGIPILILWIARTLWCRTETILLKGVIAIASVSAFLGLLWLAAGEKWLLDRHVRELCEKDGGIRVYETVTLPVDRFDKYGAMRIHTKQDAKSSDEYYYESSMIYFKKGNPEVWQSHYKVYRQFDKKLLGESISYASRGGDVPGPWHESSFGCPDKADITDLKKIIFTK